MSEVLCLDMADTVGGMNHAECRGWLAVEPAIVIPSRKAGVIVSRQRFRLARIKVVSASLVEKVAVTSGETWYTMYCICCIM